MKMRLLALIACGLILPACLSAQDATSGILRNPERRGERGWMGGPRGQIGTVTEVASDHYVIKNENGEVYTVFFSVNTRIMKQPTQRRPANYGSDGDDPQQYAPHTLKPTEIKVGDVITAGGEMDTNARTVGAVMIMQIDPERAKQLREMQANYGKTWLMGKVKSVDGVKVTLESSIDKNVHTFVADENTTFRKRREPITLGDIQVGDMLRTEGSVKEGTFTATTVSVMGAPPQGGPPRDGPPSPPQQ